LSDAAHVHHWAEGDVDALALEFLTQSQATSAHQSAIPAVMNVRQLTLANLEMTYVDAT
jgi:hypothetical protein